MLTRTEHLADLDELILRCKTPEARSYIEEAVRSYKAGAYRASIAATWIAVVFDILEKLRQLELTGHKDAQKLLAELEKARVTNDIKKMLEFERDILEQAANTFEFLDNSELRDLQLLREHRNRCAHPTLRMDGQPYAPPPELARLHLRNAVDHLLQHLPVQGKAALHSIRRIIESEYFPSEDAAAEKRLQGSPLSHPRSSLVRNLVLLGLKECLLEDSEESTLRREATALRVIHKLQASVSESTLQSEVDRLVGAVSDGRLTRLVQFLALFPYAWEAISDGQRGRIQEYVRNTPSADVSVTLSSAFAIPALETEAASLLDKLGSADLGKVVQASQGRVHEAIRDQAIALYEASTSFDGANSIANQCLIPALASFSSDELRRIVGAGASNGEVLGSFAFNTTLKAIHELGLLDLSAELESHGLTGTFGHITGSIEEDDDGDEPSDESNGQDNTGEQE